MLCFLSGGMVRFPSVTAFPVLEKCMDSMGAEYIPRFVYGSVQQELLFLILQNWLVGFE